MTVKGSVLGEGAPHLDKSLVDELKLVDPRLRWMWMPDHKCWAVVTPAPPQVFRKGYWVEVLLLDENMDAIQPTMQTIATLKKLRYERDRMVNPEDVMTEIDREHRKKEEEAEKERQQRFWDFMGKVYRFLHTKTFT